MDNLGRGAGAGYFNWMTEAGGLVPQRTKISGADYSRPSFAAGGVESGYFQPSYGMGESPSPLSIIPPLLSQATKEAV
jgi:hypothetical protein